MIRMSVLYPTTEDYVFDHDYYRDRHVPLALRTWGLEQAEIDKGVDGPYVAAVHFRFDSLETMTAALSGEGSSAGNGRCRELHQYHARGADQRDRLTSISALLTRPGAVADLPELTLDEHHQ